ncbi:ribosome production factor 2 homolog [Uloborus diversus]|uniref:ribosome production factor 2 homolog n=1 Tax=Uloborus diversus TaxID=327109 RepID=UPI002409BF7A|nr:ribosome production factor 2 homolog [Uloborus diversus]
MEKVVKPRTRPGKRFLENREPKLIENDKRTLFIRGANANNNVLQALKDFAALKKPNAVFFNRKNEMKPIEDSSKLEFFCQKNDASLFMFGSHNKKRPNNLVAGRMFDHHILDMFELGMEDFQPLKDFKTAKIAYSTKPMLLFTEGFEGTPELQRIKNFFIDFFRGPIVEYVNLQGLEHLIAFSVVNNKILLRSYRVTVNKSSSKTHGVELEEIGPHMNFVIRRTKLASEDLFKRACKKPKELKPKKKKNIQKDVFGSTHGRVHMERQDYNRLQTRKLKGLKKRKSEIMEQTKNEPNVKKMKMEESH